MTGRRLYDKFCDAAAHHRSYSYATSVLPNEKRPAVAWPFLSNHDRRVWNDMAQRITPKPRKRA